MVPPLTNYKGLQVLTSPIGNGGAAISNDLKYLVDWNPKSNWAATADPTASDDSTSSKNYQVGSLWLNTTTGALFVCTDATASSAEWIGLPAGFFGLSGSTTTTGTTPSTITIIDSEDFPSDVVLGFTCWILARRTDTGEASKVWEVRGAMKEADSSVDLIGTLSETSWGDTGTSGWSYDIDPSETGGFDVEVTGTSGQTIDWKVSVQLTQLFV